MKGPLRSLTIYWEAYGGLRALVASPYLWVALGFALLVLFWKPTRLDQWITVATNILPSILGFTLVGYVLLIGVGDENFRTAIRGKDGGQELSPFMKANAAFVHFILLQIIAVLAAQAVNILQVDSYVVDFIGMFVVAYALLLVLAAVLVLLNLASWYDDMPKD